MENTMHTRCNIHIVGMILIIASVSNSQLSVPDLDHKAYAKLGDINIGTLSSVYGYSSAEFCSKSYGTYGAIRTELPGFITDLINNNDDILPNITLGFVVLDDCSKDLTALARSVYFVPSENAEGSIKNRHYHVIGVVGPVYSRQAAMISSFLGLFEVPVLATYATSDELSDKSRFPYFSRLVPPDAFQAAAIIDIIEYFGWSYVSLLYSEGSYGENAAKQIEKLIRVRSLCLAVSRRISAEFDDVDLEKIVTSMKANKEAPVVILFLERNDVRNLFSYLRRHNISSDYQWVSGDSFSFGEYSDVANGALGIGHPSGSVPGYADHMKSLSWKNSSNPWLPLVYERVFGCSWSDKSMNTANETGEIDSCRSYDTLGEATDYDWPNPAKNADGFTLFAKALHNLISNHCPELFMRTSQRDFSGCIKGHLLIEYMRNISFEGYSGKIAFDRKGEMQGMYIIRQFRFTEDGAGYYTTVGEWDKLANALVLNTSKLNWEGDKNLANMKLESICSRPCDVGHYYQQKEVSCCWECVECRENEITVNNLTDCSQCSDFTWPDSKTRTTCESIEPYYLQSSDALGMCLLALGSLGVLLSLGTIAIYFIKHKNRLLKATSRDLSVITLAGCTLACLGAMVFVTYPDRPRCLLRQAGFHLVVCIMYSPLLVKTSRVYRIFSAGKRGTGRPKLINSKTQLVFTFILISIQVLLVLILDVLYPSESILIMPFRHEPYVEITCQVHLVSFIPPLCFNMLPIITCAVLGYLTKSLPENFNDSRYIFVSISTTLFMWIVFLPTYFTTFHAHHKAALLSVCLLLNSYITMLCQFAPKVYAVFFANEEDMVFNTMATTNTVSVSYQANHAQN